MLYFDHCASTPVHSEVIRTMTEVMTAHYANPASLHQSGIEAEKLLLRARELLAALFQTKSSEWVFTSGGTESNNLAIKGAARAYRHRGNHIITTAVEHASVLETCRELEAEGYEVTYLAVDRRGIISLEQLAEQLRPSTILVSVMHVNNEVGAIQPIERIGKLLSTYPTVLFHVDAVQSIGKLPIRLKEWHIDLFSGSAHKLRGPKGIGWLYVRETVAIKPLLSGGGQERGMRSGTPNVPGIIASAKAARLAVEGQEQRMQHLYSLRSQLMLGLSGFPELRIIAADAQAQLHAAPHIVHFCYPGMKPEVLVHLLEKHGIIVSTQSACSSKRGAPSRVLIAMGHSAEEASSGIRISLGEEHAGNDIQMLLQRLRLAIDELRPLEK